MWIPLLLNYNYSKDLNEIILKKQENSRANITQKARSLQGEMQDFQRKVEITLSLPVRGRSKNNNVY